MINKFVSLLRIKFYNKLYTSNTKFDAYLSFVSVLQNFLGNYKVENYREL